MKYYFELDRPIKDIPANELQGFLKGQKTSTIMRTIIMNEKRFLSVDYERSLRGFWYFTVKPVLEKLGLTYNKRPNGGKTCKMGSGTITIYGRLAEKG